MTVEYNKQGDLVYIDKKGNETEIEVNCSYCDACDNDHLDFKIRDFNFESEDNRYFGDMSYFDEYDRLNEEIESFLAER